ncbi:xanthine dehydrogenase family protein molybdopterin-binding subunit [Reyranella sp.]|jgi:carbon-monoxide dehydrogenase large subunit|uniref:xanthine dehydrogenase family protein molybdopterin-binding subunit n=1 Tax=Reyranella sp. TaxID=1929291 RepID=UPI000BD109A6|nr:xanthine dehydrogenase family protein molybdopterin-binding subunit [Reyranella sp.]OYY40244.1 MAG: carbon monoxide dehydrogenase [Rhodospirillales bacterium 35-66-84]OYZ92796.1 MAG: carbon monoxide dehydrogenase [Rhodospirillales bacterium 24-66-33]OZB22517.1 MAG: carbon monoxide dehydrogenase [Rhodospirillales bacterium 39-66-50]HQS18965.1 xanthine dehydrogenase family protein molybdopterin-binding subunit [Reyranella sp.]HQT12266.1 xanthine dehydrogenase family protein molybdopterin-bind
MAVFGKAQYIKRVEDDRLLTGTGGFTDNLSRPNQAHVVLVRSPHAHAKILKIDTAAAKTAPGVVAVYTWADMEKEGVGNFAFPTMFPAADGSKPEMTPRRSLAHEVVRYVGEAVVAIVADTREQAQDAVELVDIEYEQLPSVTEIEDALKPDAPQVWGGAPGNIAGYNKFGDHAKAEEAFKSAAHVVSLDIVHQRLIVNAMEPRAVMAEWENDRLIVHIGSQNPSVTRDTLCDVILKMPKDKVRVVVRDIGGGFGMKVGIQPDEAVAVWAAKVLKRPVRWRAERSEEFAATTAGRDQFHKGSMAFDKDGRILALRMEAFANIGAYPSRGGVVIPLFVGPKVTTGTYDIPMIDLRITCVITNTATIGAYRGAGRPECILNLERLMDTAARQIGMDPAELRRRNFVKPSQMPYTTAMGEKYDSGDFNLFLTKTLEAADWDGFAARKAEAEKRGKLYGRGLASYVEWTSANVMNEMAHYEVKEDGKVVIWMGTQGMGQGLQTSFTQLASELLGIDPSKIEIAMGDSDRVGGVGSMGSRSAYIGGSAVLSGSEKLVDKGKELAADALEAATADIIYSAGRFTITGTDRGIGLGELAAKQPDKRIFIENVNTVDGIAWPNGAHVGEVEIDPDTGMVELKRYTTVDDVGKPLHRPIVFGQIHGGCAQGIGQALLEENVYDRESGQLVTGSFMDYAMPRAETFPNFNNQLDDTVPAKSNPIGAKGVGESGTVGSTPTVMNAIMDALWPLGVRNIQMPATPQRVWQAIQETRK